MGIMDMFRGGSNVNAANPVPAQTPVATNGNPPVPAPTNVSPGGNPPNDGSNPGVQGVQEPNFANLWEAPKETDPQLPSFDPSKMFNLDPQKIAEAVKQIDYSKAISQEQLAAVTAGGEGAVQALANIMNSVAQQTTQVSMMGAAKLVEQALGKANETMDARMAEEIRKNQISRDLREKNPLLASQEYSPMVSALEAQFRIKYPTASAPEITKMATDYLTKFAQGITKTGSSAASDTPAEFDWGAHFGL
jgi:hypothetical protein